jgi:hypothetical protein
VRNAIILTHGDAQRLRKLVARVTQTVGGVLSEKPRRSAKRHSGNSGNSGKPKPRAHAKKRRDTAELQTA